MREQIKSLAHQIANKSPDQVEKILLSEFEDTLEKAEMLDALMCQQRIRVLGTAGIGQEKYQHIGLEMWTHHLGSDGDAVTNETIYGRSVLSMYLRTHANALRKRTDLKD